MSSSLTQRVGGSATAAKPDVTTRTMFSVGGTLGIASPPCQPVARDAVRSEPLIVEDCLAWLHQAVDGAGRALASDVAVLLCPALGWDGLHAHHGFRLLGDAFAMSGYPTMRFQYAGTGDSGDLTADQLVAGHWSVWQRNAHAAGDRLLAATGARRLLLVGLRFGAMMASVLASQRDDVDGVALLAPVLRGKSYIRQLDMEARLETGAAARDDGGLDFHELQLSEATVRSISAVDLRAIRLPGGLKVAVFPQAPSQLLDSCVEAWVGSGAQVQSAAFDGLEPLLQEAIHCDPPPPDFTALLGWADAVAPSRVSWLPGRPVPLGRPVLAVPHGVETPVRFGPGCRLFGILCRPHGPAGEKVVVIGNTGRDPHFGIARLGVELARQLAAEGTASLRMDFTGLGDSADVAGGSNALTPLFEMDRTADISAAIDALHGLGYRDIVLQGLCSGAYHAFRAALADRRVGGLVLLNLPVFQWQGGDTVREAIWKSASPSRILAKLADQSAWGRALRGESEIGSILLAQARRLAGRARDALGRRARPSGVAVRTGPEGAMAALADRRVESLFLYASNDPGIGALEMAFGREGEALRDVAGVDVRIVSGIDHVLSGRAMRERAIGLMVGFMTARSADSLKAGRSLQDDHTLDDHRPDHLGGPPAEANARAAP